MPTPSRPPMSPTPRSELHVVKDQAGVPAMLSMPIAQTPFDSQ